MKKLIAIYLFTVFSISALMAQNQRVVADKIVGKVGDRIILKSDINNAIADAMRQGMEVPENPGCVFMESELIKRALILQAEKDSITVNEEDVENKLDQQIRNFVQAYGGREALEEIAGKSLEQIKEDNRKSMKDRELADKMKDKILESIKITPIEVKTYFDGLNKDSLPYYESELEIGQVLVNPKPNRDVESYTAKQLNDIRKQIDNGTRKFEQMASLYSEDRATEQQGGVLPMNRGDKQWDPAFFNAAFKLKEGQVSSIVKSKFGLHIIKMVSRNGDDIRVRHILMIPPITQDEIKEAISRLDTVRSKLIAGTIDFGEAVSKYSDDENKFSGGWLTAQDGSTYITIDQLDKDMIPLIKDMKPGQYSQPSIFTEQNKKRVRIIYLRNRTKPHVENLKDDYNRIAQKVLAEKKQNILAKWFAERIRTFYIYLDSEYNSCAELAPWIQASVKN